MSRRKGKDILKIYVYISPCAYEYKFPSKRLLSPHFWQMYSRELEMTGLECGFVIPYLSENFVYLPLLSLEIRHLGCFESRGSYLHSFSIILCERTDIYWRYVVLNAFKWPYSTQYPFSLFLVCSIESVTNTHEIKKSVSLKCCVCLYVPLAGVVLSSVPTCRHWRCETDSLLISILYHVYLT